MGLSSRPAAWPTPLLPTTNRDSKLSDEEPKVHKRRHRSSRHGRRRELLSGPLVYGVCHVLAAAVWWLESPHGVVAIAALCAGDGLAEVVGRRWAKRSGPLPWNANKSWAGSAACAVASLGASIALLRWHGLAHPVLPLAAVSLGITALESLSRWGEWDNVAVFAGALVLSHLCLR